jgi:hypothetical protein
VNQIRKWLPDVGLANVRLHATGVAPDYADAMFNLALLLQRTNQDAEAAGGLSVSKTNQRRYTRFNDAVLIPTSSHYTTD